MCVQVCVVYVNIVKCRVCAGVRVNVHIVECRGCACVLSIRVNACASVCTFACFLPSFDVCKCMCVCARE